MRKFKGKSLLNCVNTYCVIDIETTGLDPQIDDIIEIGIIKVNNNKIIDTFSSLVKPFSPISDFISQLTGITNEKVKDCPTIDKILPFVKDFISDKIIIGHNINFDINFLYDNFVRFENYLFRNDYIDTMRLSRILFKELLDHRLSTIANHLNVKFNKMHRALIDCEITNNCYRKIKDYITKNNIDISQILRQNKTKLKAKDITTNYTTFEESNPFYNKTCVFTGTLEFPRRQAMKYVVDFGGHCADNVTLSTDYLIVGNFEYSANIKGNKSSKLRKAESLVLQGYDIKILSENVFYDLIEQNKIKENEKIKTSQLVDNNIQTKEYIEGKDYVLDTKQALYFSNLGTQFEKNNNISEAINAYGKSAYFAFEGNYVYERLYILYRKNKEYDKAINILNFAIFVFDKLINKERPDRLKKLYDFKEKLKKLTKV